MGIYDRYDINNIYNKGLGGGDNIIKENYFDFFSERKLNIDSIVDKVEKRVIEEEDDFSKIGEYFFTLLRDNSVRADESTIIKAFRRVYKSYIMTQRTLAESEAELLDFDGFEKHFKNASLGVRLPLGGLEGALFEPEEDLRDFFEETLNRFGPVYFLQRAYQTANDGNIERTEEFASYCGNALGLRNLSLSSSVLRDISGDERTSSYAKKIKECITIAYGVNIKRKLEFSMGQAILESLEDDRKKNIEDLRNETIDLFDTYVNKVLRSEVSFDFFSLMIRYLDDYFDELSVCVSDTTHPYYKMYELEENSDASTSKEKFSSRRVETGNMLVKEDYYKTLFDQTGVSVYVHPFYFQTFDIYNN